MSKKSLRKSLSAVLWVVIGLAGCAPKGDALYARAEQSLEKGEVQAAVVDLHRMKLRIAVGAVYRIVTRYFSTMSQNRSLSG